MTADGDPKKRQIRLERGLLIVFVAAIASVAVTWGADVAWTHQYPNEWGDCIYPPLFALIEAGLIGALMAWASILVWNHPGVAGGLWAAIMAFAVPLAKPMAQFVAKCGSFDRVDPPSLFDIVVGGVVVWSIPLLSSVLPWWRGMLLGTLILLSLWSFETWASWKISEATIKTWNLALEENRMLWTVAAGMKIFHGVLPVLIGFILARLMCPRQQPAAVTTMSTL